MRRFLDFPNGLVYQLVWSRPWTVPSNAFEAVKSVDSRSETLQLLVFRCIRLVQTFESLFYLIMSWSQFVFLLFIYIFLYQNRFRWLIFILSLLCIETCFCNIIRAWACWCLRPYPHNISLYFWNKENRVLCLFLFTLRFIIVQFKLIYQVFVIICRNDHLLLNLIFIPIAGSIFIFWP